MDPRIVGGRVVDITSYPHQISLREKDILHPEQSYDHLCGGSIYSERIVITAAHCVDGEVPSQFKVVAGANQRNGTEGIIIPIQEIIIHERYDPYTAVNDISLLVLAAALPLNNYTIKAIELTEKEPQHDNIATITGWGLTTESGAASDLLRETKVPIVGNEICKLRYPGMIDESMLCAGLLDVGGKDSCQMDSGGPLLVHGKLAGVVSWGFGCGDPQYPGVYANVWSLRQWLHEMIESVESALLQEN
ncbi:PREDICTED: trypsin zeta-like [Rhagoletis zephyria]|uniref:trypsin zeta-like n=1 Tax=Rhagoletis zephyria TaxID=28612 RepID=UPI0008113637|nr:PREDICTED: trypsin zeta-like [Rhagoletis zephyria]